MTFSGSRPDDVSPGRTLYWIVCWPPARRAVPVSRKAVGRAVLSGAEGLIRSRHLGQRLLVRCRDCEGIVQRIAAGGRGSLSREVVRGAGRRLARQESRDAVFDLLQDRQGGVLRRRHVLRGGRGGGGGRPGALRRARDGRRMRLGVRLRSGCRRSAPGRGGLGRGGCAGRCRARGNSAARSRSYCRSWSCLYRCSPTTMSKSASWSCCRS